MKLWLPPGGKYAVYLAVRGLVNPGDEVIYLEPGWISYPAIIQASSKDCWNTGIQDIELGNCKGMGAYDQLHATEAPR